MATSQNRCVFVGNIPYDTTEKQLIEICEEVGPVVSFRLVKDRDTGKPKGYGFCEYNDEETALRGHLNLQGYEINGRKLRVNFADRNREQTPQKQEEAANHQPIGLYIAIRAATVMESALGGHQNGLTHDPLTLHLAKLSRNQLTEIISELKAMATQNPQAARHLLLSRPQLAKALFQAEIMLGMVTPQMLQMPNIGSSGERKRNEPSSSDSEAFSRPSKKIKLDDANKYGSFSTGVVTNEQHFSHLPSDVQSLLLQQVRSLTPEQLSSLPPEQQQQVLLLQQALRAQTS